MTRPEILSGYVPTTVPFPPEVPTRLPGRAGPVVVPTVVPFPAVVETEVPAATVIPTPVPGPVYVPTPIPFWVRQTLGLLRAQGEITVEVVEVMLAADEALRGQGEIPVSVSGMDLPAAEQLRGRGGILAEAGMILSAGAQYLRGRGAVLAASALMVLPGGSRLLEGRGAVSAAVQSIILGASGQQLAGRGAITVSSVSQYLPPPVFRMYKTNTQTGTGTSYFSLNGMVIDPAYGSANVSSGTALEIPSGLTPYTATVRAEVPHTGGTAPRYGQTRIMRNGSVVATGSQQSASPGTSFAEWTGTVQGGDRYVIVWRGEGDFFNRPTAQAGAFLQVTPN